MENKHRLVCILLRLYQARKEKIFDNGVFIWHVQCDDHIQNRCWHNVKFFFCLFFLLPSFEGSIVNSTKNRIFILFTVTMGLPLRFSFRADISFSFTEGHTNISDERYSRRRRCTNFLINNRIISITANLCIRWLLGNVGILFRITKFVNNRTHLRDSHIGTRNLDN